MRRADIVDIVSVVVGGVILVAVTRDMFSTLFVPHGHGRLGKMLSRTIWTGCRRSQRLIGLAGPLIPVVVIFIWATALVIGWALIYMPLLADHYIFPDDLPADQRTGPVAALYLSLVTLTTLGFGDIYPQSDLMRILTPVEAFMGFAIITASLTWFISVYSVLSNQRGLAQQVSTLRDAEQRSGTAVERLDSQTASAIYAQLTSSTIVVFNDLVQYPTTYYFHGPDDESNLSYTLPYLYELAQRGQQPGIDSAVRFQAMALSSTLEKACDAVSQQYFSDGPAPCVEVIARIWSDHYPRRGQPPLASDR